MALQNYYELSAMLRLQLPILLSFAFLRSLMGKVTIFWARRLTSDRFKTAIEPVSRATDKTLSLLHGLLLSAAVWYTALSYSAWQMKITSRYPETSLVCAEYDNTRVQGLVCASGLLTLFTNSDPLTLGLALATFKAVADGSITSILLSALTWGASVSVHDSLPTFFFGMLFTFAAFYNAYCYSDVQNQHRTHGATIAASFAMLSLVLRASAAGTRRVWRGLKRSLAWTRLSLGYIRRRLLALRHGPEHAD